MIYPYSHTHRRKAKNLLTADLHGLPPGTFYISIYNFLLKSFQMKGMCVWEWVVLSQGI